MFVPISHNTVPRPSTELQMIISSKPECNGKKKKMLYHVESNDQYSQRNYPSSVYADLVPIRNFVSFALEKVDKSGLQNQRCAVCRCTN
ncbi:hypothetical protein N7582_005367 [Saccharomyces uvarum]|nr:hypothetical protein N7582_005367 [Saccharomyces uvarum]